MVVDTREQYPLLFPDTVSLNYPKSHRFKVLTSHTALSSGDYALAGYEHLARVERKGSLQELVTNLLTADRRRCIICFERLAAECSNPYILIELSAAQALTPTRQVPVPSLPVDHLLHLTSRLGIQTIWAGNCRTLSTRRKLGELIVRLLVQSAINI